jgi:predicted DNA-binding protein
VENASTKLEADKKIRTCKGEHCINIFISYELKEKISQLAKRYDRTMADVVRTLIKIGIPILESLTEAEEKMLVDYIQVLRRWRKVRELKSNEEKLNTQDDNQ